MSIIEFYSDISQVKDDEIYKHNIRCFLESASRAEPKHIHSINNILGFDDTIIEDTKEGSS